ncbi:MULTISPECIES: hypothetical protein [unclassified Streptomyces]|uniref:hypothetical protein n=1 Tax=unclassified Streptomyces TaxID=2593676 RepID=UPI0014476457|nr:hypothetical protein [Streptomyces sp. A1136]
MPIDPYAALNAMLRAEAARSTPPSTRRPESEHAGRDTVRDTGLAGNAPRRPAEAAPAE